MKTVNKSTFFVLFLLLSISFSSSKAYMEMGTSEGGNNMGEYNYEYGDDNIYEDKSDQKVDEDYYRAFVENFTTYENPYKIIDGDFNSGIINKVTWEKAWYFIKDKKQKDFNNFKKETERYKNDMKDFKNQSKNEIKENKQEIKNNIKNFKQENGPLTQYFSGITQEQKDELLKLRDDKQKEINELIFKINSGYLSDEDVAQIKDEITSINNEFIQKIKGVIGENEELLKYFQLRTEVFESNKEIRQENMEIRNEIKDKVSDMKQTIKNQRDELRLKYKGVFTQKLEGRLEKMTDETINKVLVKVDTMITKYEESKLKEEIKEKLIAQLEALKELLEENLSEVEEEMIDIEEILDVSSN